MHGVTCGPAMSSCSAPTTPSNATLRLAVPAGEDDRLQVLLAELTGGSAIPRCTRESWADA